MFSHLFCTTTFQWNLNLCCLLAIPTHFASRVTIKLSVDNTIELLLELKINGHESRGTVERSIGSVQLDG